MHKLKQCCVEREKRAAQTYASGDDARQALIAQGNYQIALLEQIAESLKQPKQEQAKQENKIGQHSDSLRWLEQAKQAKPKVSWFSRMLWG